MTKRLAVGLTILMLLTVPLTAQVIVGNFSVTYVYTAPSGACSSTAPMQMAVGSGQLYSCQNGTWTVIGGNTATPGGSSGQLQYNAAGSFGGTAGVTYDGSNGLGITGSINAGGNTAIGVTSSTNPLQVGSGANTYLQVVPPAGTFSSTWAIRPGGSSGIALFSVSTGAIGITVGNGFPLNLGSLFGGSTASQTFQINGNTSYVNSFVMSGGSAGNAPTLAVQGSDTNVGMNINPKGSGQIGIGGTPKMASLQVFANNAAAIAGGLSVGSLYRTGGDPDAVSVVH